tara:strand:- start:521 stop:1762 length:1242 start_codon:yes stop_codon:yes gene_type:complete
MALTKVSSLGVQSGVGGTDWQSVVTASTLNAESGKGYPIDTSSNACTITMPSNPSPGDTIVFMDYARNFGTNAITINQNSKNFQGNTSPNAVYNTNGQSITCVYINATKGWIPQVDDEVTLETPQSYTIDYLVIGGGGGGASGLNSPYVRTGGGGGAGGYRNSYNNETSGGGGSSETSLTLGFGVVLTADIGAGGAGASSAGNNGTVGEDTTLTGTGVSITSAGGGRGGASSSNGGNGGSGGGGGAINGSTSGGTGTANQGYNGSGGAGNVGGAGGGAGEAGGTDAGPSGYTSGNMAGGDGLSSSITGSAVIRGGGGSGAASTTVTPGSDGGGGASGTTNGAGANGTANTGGGGGSSGENNGSAGNGGTGGSGVVILRMPTAQYSGTTTGSPTVTQDGSDTIITFNGDGSYTT